MAIVYSIIAVFRTMNTIIKYKKYKSICTCKIHTRVCPPACGDNPRLLRVDHLAYIRINME